MGSQKENIEREGQLVSTTYLMKIYNCNMEDPSDYMVVQDIIKSSLRNVEVRKDYLQGEYTVKIHKSQYESTKRDLTRLGGLEWDVKNVSESSPNASLGGKD